MTTKKKLPAKNETKREPHFATKQREYHAHASKIKMMCVDGLDKLLEPKHLNGNQIGALLRFLRHRLPYDMLASIEENLKFQLKETDSIHINTGSFIRYLTVLPCRKIRASPISFDEDTGKLTIWYNSNCADHESVKVSVIPNEYDFTFSVLSRADGLAVMSGSLKLHTDGLYKIEAFMDTTLALAVTTTSENEDDINAGM